MATNVQIVSRDFIGHMGEYAGAQTPVDFGDPRREYLALQQGCGLSLLNWRAKIGLKGSDRVRWLNGMVTNNIRDLAVGSGIYSFLLNAQGRILGDLNAYNEGDALIVDTDQSQRERIVATFDHFIIMDDVEILDLNGSFCALGIAGPKSREILQKVGITVPDLAPLQFVTLSLQDESIRVVRDGDVSREVYELWMKPPMEGAIWQALTVAGATPVGSAALEMDRIARGIPRYGQDLRERDLPQETEQHRALNFNKGCYVGQEIVERIRSRGNVHRTFTGFLVNGPAPEPGTKIESQGKEVGEVTSAATLPVGDGESAVALGYIRREAIATSREVLIGGTRAIVNDLPFSNVAG